MPDGPLLCDPAIKAEIEAANGVEQIDYLDYLVNQLHVEDVRESHVLELHSIAIKGIYPCGGHYRDARRTIHIRGSSHEVPEAALVPGLVVSAVGYLNGDGRSQSALHRAAYALWRFNWIHPFSGGNGRTSRAIAYLVLCVDMRMMLPGVPTVPTLIYERRQAYVDALRAADRAEKDTGKIDLSVMESYLRDIVTRQLATAIDRLGSPPPSNGN